MSSPIASNKNLPANVAAQGGGLQLGDLASRLASQQAGGAGLSFAQLMSQHQAAEPAPKAPAKPAQASQPPKAPQVARQPVATKAPAARPEQPVAPTTVQRPADKPAARADSRGAKPATREGARAESADKATDERASSSADRKDATTTDAGVVARELQPPSQIQPGDAQGLMAWLASQAEAEALGSEAAQLQAGAEQAAQADHDPRGAQSGADGAGAGAFALDAASWRQASGTVALQADTMLKPVGASGEQKVETDALAHLMAGGLKGAAPQAGRAEGTTQSATLATPVYSPDFAQALTDQVKVWVGQASVNGPMTAELHLNPAEMGPINVKISLDGQSAQVDFAAAALETRKAIEASMSLLSSALDSVGLSLTGAGVSDQTAQQGFGQQFAQAGAERGALATGRGDGADADASLDSDGAMRPVSAPRPGRLGGLDLYA